jgi:hypothetical protein
MSLYTVNIILSDSEIDGEGRNFRGDATLSWHRPTGLDNPRFFSQRASWRDKRELALRGESLILWQRRWMETGLEGGRVQSRRSRDMCHVVESDPFYSEATACAHTLHHVFRSVT